MAEESPAVNHLAWATQPIYFGRLGANLNKALDALDPQELSRMSNVVPLPGGGVEARYGLGQLATLGTNIHSCTRMNDPKNTTFSRFWGVDAIFGRAQTGGIGSLEAGFSGDPLSFVQWQSELTGTPWIYVADRLKMRKATLTSVSQPIGIAKPAAPAQAPSAVKKVAVAAFNAADGTGAAAWTSWSGRAVDPATGNPGACLLADAPGIVGTGLAVTPQAGTVTGGGYYSAAFLQKALNLGFLAPGGTPVTDDDLFHIRMLIDNPAAIAEIRVYMVVSPVFVSEANIPGQFGALNTSAYMRSFTPAEYAASVEGQQTAAEAAAQIAEQNLLIGSQDPTVTGATTPSASSLVGANIFTEFGIAGLPVRLGDFLKIGTAGSPGFTWENVTGIVLAIVLNTFTNVNVTFNDAFIQGGGNLDTAEQDALGYDYRATNVSKSSGAESNPSDAVATTIEVLHGTADIQPVAAGNPDYYQRFYRRGGTISDDWYFVGGNTNDGQLFVDNTTDIAALVAGPVNIDHDQPITTADLAGNAVYGQAVPVIFGPIEDFMLALGDPFRPGDIYWCKQGEPDHWPSANHETVCPPGEQLMNGGKLAAGQAFAFSRERLYSGTVSSEGVSFTPTECSKGLAGRWAQAVGPGGVYFVAKSDAVYVTTGGTPKVLSDNIGPLLKGVAKNGYFPVDWTQENSLRLAIHGQDLWFGFQDTAGSKVWWIYSLIYESWRFAQFAVATSMVYSEANAIAAAGTLIVGGSANGKAYRHDSTVFRDDGAAFTCNIRTGASDFGKGREEKLLGDLTIWGNLAGAILSATMYYNSEKSNSLTGTIAGTSTYDRYLYDIFGTVPQHTNTAAVDLSWPAAAASTSQVIRGGVAVALQPEVTMNRATQWEPLNDKGESYLTGCWIDSDTGGSAISMFVEGLLNGQPAAVTTISVNSAGGRKQWFSWPAVHVDMIRLRPNGVCAPWMLFGIGWLSTPEPPRIAVWDSGFENLGDTYATGLDLEIDTFGVNKTLVLTVDGVAVSGSPYTVNANGRSFVHLTFLPVRGHIYRLSASDASLGLLYTHKWIVEAEPGEQTNWNQNYTIAGTQADKWLKGFVVECDTQGQDKTINVEVDGAVIAGSPFTVNTNGRKVVQVGFAQVLGRVFRLLPTDTKPSRLYTMGWLFDEEPYCLTRFETQEQPNGIADYQIPVSGQVAIKSTAVVSMRVIAYGQAGVALADTTYALPSTAGVKAMVSLHTLLTAQKGLLFKFIFTSANGFWLYREESWIELQPWKGGPVQKSAVFGSDDLDPSRPMRSAALAAARSGGSLTG